jgi:type I restriction enzyme S subunit
VSGTVSSLASVSTLITKGTTPTTLGYAHSGSGIPFLRVQNIFGGQVNFEEDTLFIGEDTHAALKRSQIQGGDVLVTIAGTIGRTGVVPLDAPSMNCNQAVAIVRPTAQIERSYLRHWLESQAARSQMIGSTVTGTISNLSLTQLGELKVPLPPLEEQRRIAAILDQAETLRTQRRQALAHLDTLTQSLFLDMFGDPAANPNLWPVKALKELGKVITGGTPPSSKEGMFDGPIPFVTPGDLESDAPVRRSITEAGAKEVDLVRAGATLVCCIGATIGKVGMAQKESAFNQQLNAVVWENDINDHFGYEVMRFFKPTIVSWGASTTLPILKKSSFERIAIPVPPLYLQEVFASRLQVISDLKGLHKAALADLDELFSALQSKAFAGEL